MYPLAMTNDPGFAVANSEDEHKALTELGFLPAFREAEPTTPAVPQDLDSVRAALDNAGVPYDKRIGLDKLLALLPA